MAGLVAASNETSEANYFDVDKRTDALTFDVRTEVFEEVRTFAGKVTPCVCQQAHPPSLYTAAEPEEYNRVEGGLSAVDKKAMDGFSRLGYIVVGDALSDSAVKEVLSALGDVVADPGFAAAATETAQKQAAGEVNLAFGGCHPVLQFENFAKDIAEADRFQLQNVRKLMGFHNWHPRLTALATDPSLLAVIRGMLLEAGASEDEVAELDVYQSLALLKPKGGREKPWHQDNSYFNIDGDEVKAAGVWIALSDVTIENGAMHVLPGPLKELQPLPHFSRRDWQICDSFTDGKPCVAVPLSPGGALFFSTMLPHGTPTNLGETQRLAIQFHFAPKNYKTTSDAARLATWGGEGIGVHC